MRLESCGAFWWLLDVSKDSIGDGCERELRIAGIVFHINISISVDISNVILTIGKPLWSPVGSLNRHPSKRSQGETNQQYSCDSVPPFSCREAMLHLSP